jgi:colanic acid biosynthesis glycosyl transferase WcaI
VKVLYLSYYFPPEIGTGPHLPFEMCETLVKKGHEVTVVTGFPRYHLEIMPEKYRGHFLFAEEMGGAKVFRINTFNAYTKNRYLRGMAQQMGPWLMALRAMCLKIKPEVVFTPYPPLIMGWVARFVAKWFHIPYVVNVQDLFPQCAIDLGMLKNAHLIRVLEWIEKDIYRKTPMITVMSEGNREYLIAKGASPDRVQLACNWADTDLIRPGERMNEFRNAHNLGDKFIVLFAGTMGWSQGLHTVVDAARELAHDEDILFLLVGDGVEREKTEKQAEGLKNIRFLPMQSKEVYPQVLAACDSALVTLRPEVNTPTVPSKIATIMAAGRPILASMPLHGDAPKFVTEANAGIVVPPGDATKLAAAVLELKSNPARAAELGENGRRYSEQKLSRDSVIRLYEDIFSKLIEQNKAGEKLS